MDNRVAASLIDSTASITEVQYAGAPHFKVSGVFANGTDAYETAPWTTGLFLTQERAWNGAVELLSARNSGRFN